ARRARSWWSSNGACPVRAGPVVRSVRCVAPPAATQTSSRAVCPRRLLGRAGPSERPRVRLRQLFNCVPCPGPCSASSPDRDALLGSQPECVAFRDVELIVERIDVAHDLIAPELVGRVRVDREQADRLGVAALLLPHLRPREEDALAPREPVDDGGFFAVERELIGGERDAEAAEIADVLADREGAVDGVRRVEALRRERVVLVDEALRAL